jgi:hypothetical protein
MAIPNCTADTTVITNIGTTPDERGLSTDEFKAKFDEASTNIKNDLNNNIIPAIKEALPGTTPSCRVYHSTNQSIPTATFTPLAFDSERFDTDNIHDNATNNTRLTCKTAGKYLIIANVRWGLNANNQRDLRLRLNGTTYIADALLKVSAAEPILLNVSTIYDLAVNDYVEAVAYQDSGGALDIISTANYSPEFMMVKVG